MSTYRIRPIFKANDNHPGRDHLFVRPPTMVEHGNRECYEWPESPSDAGRANIVRGMTGRGNGTIRRALHDWGSLLAIAFAGAFALGLIWAVMP